MISTVLGIAKLVALCVGIAAVVALGVMLTVNVLRTFRIKHNTKMLIANTQSIIDSIPDKDKRTMSMDDLENYCNQTIVSEYDPVTNEVIQTKVCDKGLDSNIQAALDDHDGYIIVD